VVTMSATQPAKLSKLGRAALWYAGEKAWRVFPLHTITNGQCSCGKAECGGPGKHPRTPKGCLDATDDTATIREWWTRWPDANVGIATGNGLIVVDIDPRHGGDDTLRDLLGSIGGLPDTVECLTGGGGRHIYLSTPADVRNSANVLGPGVDVRGAGGYVVAAPSMHASGRAYGWEASSRPEDTDVGQLPEAWIAAMVKRPKLRVVAGGAGDPIPDGQRNEVLFRRGASMRAAGFDQQAIEAALQAENENRCVPSMDPAEVKAIAASVCRYPEGLSPEYQAKRDEADARRLARASTAQVTNETGEWEADLYRTGKGAVRNTFANVCSILRNAEEYVSLRYNAMALAPMMHARLLSDADLGALREAVERRYGFSPGTEALAQGVLTVATERQYHPVAEYLRGLVWDGTPRIDRVCGEILRAEVTPIHVTMIRAFFISLAARALRPGCKVDTAPVLVGPQGARKSGFFRVLGGEWFLDTGINLDNKDSYQQMHYSWIYEWGEIEHITGKSHAGKVKAFIASQTDTFRLPFMRVVSQHHRGNVIVGSTNEDQFLNDPTGSRRFWPIRVNARADLETLAAWRDQLFAEAATALDAGETWWLSDEAETALAALSDDFRASDTWEEPIAHWIATTTEPVTTRNILGVVLGFAVGDQKQAEQNRVSAVMVRLGYRNQVRWLAGRAQRLWEIK